MAKIVPIKRLIVGHRLLLVGEVIFSLQLDLVHVISIGFVELVVVGGAWSLGRNLVVVL